MAKVHDFDAFRKERAQRAPRFILFDREWILPPTLRYDAVLAFQRMAKRDKAEKLSDDEVFSVFQSVLGDSVFEELRAYTEFDLELATTVVTWALSQYNVTEESDSDPKENNSQA